MTDKPPPKRQNTWSRRKKSNTKKRPRRREKPKLDEKPLSLRQTVLQTLKKEFGMTRQVALRSLLCILY